MWKLPRGRYILLQPPPSVLSNEAKAGELTKKMTEFIEPLNLRKKKKPPAKTRSRE
jgi:hypothetical protein